MDKSQADMIRMDDHLAYPRADCPPALLKKVNETVRAGKLGGFRGNRGYDIPEFPGDVVQPRWKVFQKLLNDMGG